MASFLFNGNTNFVQNLGIFKCKIIQLWLGSQNLKSPIFTILKRLHINVLKIKKAQNRVLASKPTIFIEISKNTL